MDLDNTAVYMNNTLSAGGTNIPDYWDQHFHYYTTYYPWYVMPEKSKLEQSFRIVGKLIEKRLVHDMTVREFIELVNEIAGVI